MIFRVAIRPLLTVIAVVALTVWANHCILGDVLASSTTKQQSSHCHDEDSSKSGNHHSECQDQGCCQPAIQASHSVDSGSAVILSQLPAVVVATLEVPSPMSVPALIRSTSGPPIHLFQALIALSIAPNAPPL